MQKEYFKILKEINSLLIKKKDLEALMEKELKRIEFIKGQRNKRNQLLEDKISEKKELCNREIKIENELSLLQKNLDQAKGHINSIFDENQEKALNNQIHSLEEKINNLEEEGLILLESIEICDVNISESKSFLEGSLNSLNEIEDEVNKINQEHLKQIETINLRIDSLKNELPDKFSNAINNALKKRIAISIFSRINHNKCDFCKLGLSKVDEDSVEKRLELLTCSGCKRIFIPENSLY